MPILFIVKQSRRRLFAALRRLVARPGLVGVVLERRQQSRRRRQRPIDFEDRRMIGLRQPLDRDGARTWTQLGFMLVKVRQLPEARQARGDAPAGSPRPRRARRSRSPVSPARRAGSRKRP